jgi:hypothetical protein
MTAPGTAPAVDLTGHLDALAARPPVLSDAEASRRTALLERLRETLTGLGVECVLARNRRLVLRYNQSPLEPSGLTELRLHVFGPGGKDIVTTDGASYRLASGAKCGTDDPAGAAALVVSALGLAGTP